MRGDLPAAACRLLETCTVRTHIQPQHGDIGARFASTVVKAVKIAGVEYPSVIEASRQLRIDRSTIRRMIDRGEAKYA